jgi:hypothetical protein
MSDRWSLTGVEIPLKLKLLYNKIFFIKMTATCMFDERLLIEINTLPIDNEKLYNNILIFIRDNEQTNFSALSIWIQQKCNKRTTNFTEFYEAIRFLSNKKIYFITLTNAIKYKDYFFGEIKSNKLCSSLRGHKNLLHVDTNKVIFAPLCLSDADIIKEIFEVTALELNKCGYDVTYYVDDNQTYFPAKQIDSLYLANSSNEMHPKFLKQYAYPIYLNGSCTTSSFGYTDNYKYCGCEVCNSMMPLIKSYNPVNCKFCIKKITTNN